MKQKPLFIPSILQPPLELEKSATMLSVAAATILWLLNMEIDVGCRHYSRKWGRTCHSCHVATVAADWRRVHCRTSRFSLLEKRLVEEMPPFLLLIFFPLSAAWCKPRWPPQLALLLPPFRSSMSLPCGCIIVSAALQLLHVTRWVATSILAYIV